MAAFVWTAQDTNGGTVTVGATDIIGFYGSTFNTAITVSSYQDGTHIENSSNVEQCATYHIHNTKYLTSSTMSLDGAASAALTTLTTGNCPLKINFSHTSSVITTSNTFWAYDGSTDANVPTNITFQAAEQSDAAWTNAEGSAAAVTITDDTTATSHDYYVAVSVSPEAVGDLTVFALKMQLTYQ